jgi:1-phosphatidylinositol-3-phosphate 5-kinase
MSDEIRQTNLSLLQLLASCPAEQVNDVRRAFAANVSQILIKAVTWQKTHASEESFAETPLRIPNYADNRTEGKVWALPGSAVLVREEEPSSVIAYTMS